MKNFRREHLEFSQCGLNCLLCPMHINKYCPGCGGGDGNQSCAVARCAIEQKAGEFCSQCSRFPCKRLEKIMEYDSFLPHSQMLQDLKRAEEVGLDAYRKQLEERRAILDQLLADWNDSKRKSFFCLAVYLLELDGLCRAFGEILEAGSGEVPIKEKALTAAAALKAEAQKQGVTLKLNKRPKER